MNAPTTNENLHNFHRSHAGAIFFPVCLAKDFCVWRARTPLLPRGFPPIYLHDYRYWTPISAWDRRKYNRKVCMSVNSRRLWIIGFNINWRKLWGYVRLIRRRVIVFCLSAEIAWFSMSERAFGQLR